MVVSVMHDDSEKRIEPAQNVCIRSTVRFLIDDPALGWRLFPLTRALVAYQGELRMPEYAGMSVRIAFAHMELEDGRPAVLKRLECSAWHLDDEGRIDQDRLMEGIVERIDPVAGTIDFRLLASVSVTDEDISAIQRCLLT